MTLLRLGFSKGAVLRLILAIWTIGVASLLISPYGLSIPLQSGLLLAPGIMALNSCLCFLGYLLYGGRRIGPASIVFLGLLVFIVLPQFLVIDQFQQAEVSVVFASLFLTVSLLLVLPSRAVPVATAAAHRSARHIGGLWLLLVAPAVVGAAALLASSPELRLFSGPLIGMAAVAAGLKASQALARNERIRALALLLFFGVLLFAWFEVYFSGGGRLQVAALGFSVAAGLSMLRPRQFVKTGLLVIVVPGILWGGLVRAQNASLRDVLEAQAGLGSVIAPFDTFAMLVDRSDTGLFASREYAHQLALIVGVFVPRAIWPDKPEGYGRLLAVRLGLGGNHGHSMAASIFGYFYSYFGGVGLYFAVASLWFHVAIGGFLLRLSVAGPSSMRGVVFVFTTYYLGSLPTLVWAGEFSFWARVLPALVVVLPVALVTTLSSRHTGGHHARRPFTRTVLSGPTSGSEQPT